MVDINLPDPLDPATDGTWGPPINSAINGLANALAAAGVAFTVEGTELVVEREDGTETRLPLPAGVKGDAGPAGGTDAATAEWVEDGPLTSAALSAKNIEALDNGTDYRAALDPVILAVAPGGGGGAPISSPSFTSPQPLAPFDPATPEAPTGTSAPSLRGGSASLRGNGTNVGLGEHAQERLTTGLYNTAIGSSSQQMATTARSNVALGFNAQMSLTTGSSNNAVGDSAQQALTTGLFNNANGYRAQRALTTGSSNNAMGNAAQTVLTSGSANNAFGDAAQRALLTGTSNVAVGNSAQQAMTTGSSNTAVGANAQYGVTTGGLNVGIGTNAQYGLTTGPQNVGIGYDVQKSVTTGGSNVGIGFGAQTSPGAVPANATTTATAQTCIGRQSGQASTAQVDQIVTIGFNATAGAIKASAFGSYASSVHAGSVALGSDTLTTAVGQVMVGPRDVEITDTTKGIVLKSPDGTRYRLTVANGGAISAATA